VLVAVPYAMRVGSVDGAVGGVITSELTVGSSNSNSGLGSFVAGVNNSVTGNNSVIAGGEGNSATALTSTISGGHTHTASGVNSTIGGGAANLADNTSTTIGGGTGNRAQGDAATVGGGYINRATGTKSVVGGGFSNVALGEFSAIPGGADNTASGDNSFAAGTKATAQHAGSFVWSDFAAAGFASSDSNQFLIRARGGVGIGTNSPMAALHVAPLSGSQAAQFDGDVAVAGTLSKSAGAFRIDHPLDPANKYLQHSFVESPDMMNLYNGNVSTDKGGRATVLLPGYFGTLNGKFRYQLTVIGEFAQAIVAEKIKGNSFVIQTDKPNIEVSWQVTGIRKDKWAEGNRIEVEVDKLQAENLPH